MKLAKELAQYLRQALEAAEISATVKAYTDSTGGEYVEVVEERRDGRRGALLGVARLEVLSVPRATVEGTVDVDVNHWHIGMDVGPQQWHPDEPPTDAVEELGPYPGPGTAAIEFACAIVRQRVLMRITGYAMARGWDDDDDRKLKLEV